MLLEEEIKLNDSSAIKSYLYNPDNATMQKEIELSFKTHLETLVHSIIPMYDAFKTVVDNDRDDIIGRCLQSTEFSDYLADYTFGIACELDKENIIRILLSNGHVIFSIYSSQLENIASADLLHVLLASERVVLPH